MQPSMEVRWFLTGTAPKEVEQWFRRGYVSPKDAPIDNEARDDIYLSLPDSAALGIKLRAGKKIEVKQRQSSTGVQTLRAGIEGGIEQWVKWSFDLMATDDKGEPIRSPHEIAPPGYWTIIKKRRLLRKFAVIAAEKVITVDAVNQRPDEGCNMELVWLEVNGKQWWSLGFESFGKLDTVEKNLRLVLEQVLPDPNFPEMRAEQSYAYPAWLGMLLK